jgi:hypothetical protein
MIEITMKPSHSNFFCNKAVVFLPILAFNCCTQRIKAFGLAHILINDRNYKCYQSARQNSLLQDFPVDTAKQQTESPIFGVQLVENLKKDKESRLLIKMLERHVMNNCQV